MKNISEAKLTEFKKKYSFQSRMSSGGLDSYDNYIGDDLGDLIIVASISRDSDLISESNFNVALEMLGGESEDVEIHRFSHWACGWIESIMVNPNNRKALLTAYEIKKSLEDYPLLDDSDYCEREHNKIQSDIEYYVSDFCRELKKVIETDLETDESLELLASAIYQKDCEYHGHDDAWVNEESIKRFLESYEAKDFINNKWYQLLINKIK